MSGAAKIWTYRVVAALWACAWLWWGIDMFWRNEQQGQGRFAAFVMFPIYMLAERWSREPRRLARETRH